MRNSFNKQNELPGEAECEMESDMKRGIEQIRIQLEKGMELEDIAEKLHMDREYAEFLFRFGIV